MVDGVKGEIQQGFDGSAKNWGGGKDFKIEAFCHGRRTPCLGHQGQQFCFSGIVKK